MLNPAITLDTPLSVRSGLTATPAAGRTQAACLRFTTVLLCVCLFLQRFGLPVGGQPLSIVGPIGLALGAWGLWHGTLVLHRARTAIYLGLVGLALLGAAWHAMSPGAFDAAPSTNSLLHFVGITGLATLSFAEPVDEAAFFARISRLLAIVAGLGIAQFAAQFAGLRLFAFTGLLPANLLMEQGYNLVIPVGIGDVLKSNGLFLIEPSVFSQFMAVALMIELLTLRRPAYFALFTAALLLSFSGTGWIVLASFFLFAGVRLGPQFLKVALVSACALGLMAAAAAVAAPDFAAALSGRLSEISQPGTSGHLRFITPFWLMSDVLAREPSALFAGIGAGVSEKLSLAYAFDVNTPVKVFLEYGLPLLVAYLALFWQAARTALQGALFVPLMLLFLFTGGYQQFPPVLFPVLLLLAIARLVPSNSNCAGRLNQWKRQPLPPQARASPPRRSRR